MKKKNQKLNLTKKNCFNTTKKPTQKEEKLKVMREEN